MRPCLLNSCAACATPSLTPPNPSDRSARHWQSTLYHQLQSLKQMSQTPLQSSPPCPPIAFAEVLPHIYKSTTDDERATIWTTGKDGWHGAALRCACRSDAAHRLLAGQPRLCPGSNLRVRAANGTQVAQCKSPTTVGFQIPASLFREKVEPQNRLCSLHSSELQKQKCPTSKPVGHSINWGG